MVPQWHSVCGQAFCSLQVGPRLGLCGKLSFLIHTVPYSLILPSASLCYGPASGDLGYCSHQHILSGLLLVRQAPF